MPRTIAFSPDGQRMAYVANGEELFALCVDGEIVHEYLTCLNPPQAPVFSRDGSKVALLHGMTPEIVQLWYDGNSSAPFDYEVTYMPVWSPDNSRIAYGGMVDGKCHLVVGDFRTGDYEGMSQPVFSPQGAHWGCVFFQDGQNVLVLDGEEVARHQRVSKPVFSSDDEQVAYCVRDRQEFRIVLNGEYGPAYRVIDHEAMGFGPHDEHFYYKAQSRDGECVVIDSVPGETFYSLIGSPVAFSPDGSRYAYAAAPTSDSTVVVVDGERSEPFDILMVPPVFSPDGRHVAYVAQRDGESYIVVNDAWSEAYTGIFGGSQIVFTTDDRFNVIMLKDGEDYVRANVEISVTDNDVSEATAPVDSGDEVAESAEQDLPRADRQLTTACRTGSIDTVIQRLAEGCEVNARTTHGETPLHLASRLEDPTIAMILLRAGADPLIPNEAGELPLEVMQAHELAPSDANDYFTVVQNRMVEQLEWACFAADELLAQVLNSNC